MKNNFIIIILLSVASQINAQNYISGYISSGSNPLEYASVVLLNTIDSAYITGTITSKKGLYELSTNKDSVIIYISSLGREEIYATLSLKKQTQYSIDLKEKSIEINAIVVTAKKPLVEMKLDRMVFNVSASIIASSGTAWESLTHTPGVKTDFNGSVKVNNISAKILIDDRLVNLGGDELMNYISSIPASSVEKIEIITNPPAKYDAVGGVLVNIVLKKDQSLGFKGNFSTTYSQSRYPKIGTGFNFNFRKKKINLYGILNGEKKELLKEEESYINYDATSSFPSTWNNNNTRRTSAPAGFARLGLDVFLGKHTIGLQINAFGKKANVLSNTSSFIFNNSNQLDSIINTLNTSETKTSQLSYNLNYEIDFGKKEKKNKKISFNADYIFYNYLPKQKIEANKVNNIFETTSNPILVTTSDSEQNVNILTSQIDYSQSLNIISATFNLGGKISFINTNNDLDFQSVFPKESNFNNSNSFSYKEDNFALYSSIAKNYKKFSINLGLRAENTSITTFSSTLDSLNEISYFKIFPSLFIQNTLNENNILNFSLGRRIVRPDYWRLNPFQYYLTPYYYLTGNPFLRPEILYNFQLTYLFKGKYYLSLFHNRSRDSFTNIAEQDNENKVYKDIQYNINKTHGWGGYIYIPLNKKSWYHGNLLIQGIYQNQSSFYLEDNFNFGLFNVYLGFNNAFLLSESRKIWLEVNAWYNSPSYQGIYRMDELYDISVGLKFNIFKYLSVNISINDLLYSNIYKLDVNYNTQQNGFLERNDTRMIRLNILYNFGNNKVKKTRKRKNTAEDEKRRLRK